MSKQSKKPSFGDDLDAPASPLLNDARLYGVQRPVVPLPASRPLAAVEPAPTPPPPKSNPAPGSEEEWLKFSSFLRRSTYVRLKQSEYWDRLVLKKAVDAAVCAFLEKMEGADKPLPPEEEYRLQGRKLR
ncbi:hypothetical protein [Hymenobacter sp. YC55]|uniref:hypothetical protein n=1 Tax=Hymenobacter sp. YC55 TaxID=3034019 RepID=UPI0023F727F5|nr:hypothetical protein [Hymenobacter sp. YC55]MDF7815755.1 hypothetical protein [Hymenobacter sp. YC55]